MSLIDELRDIGAALPPSHIPGLAEALPIVGALVAAAEHDVGQLLDAVKADLAAAERGDQPSALNELLAPSEEVSAPAPASESPAPAPLDPATAPAPQPPSDQAELVQVRSERDELAAQVAALSQQVQTLVADRDRTQASVEPAPPAPDLPTSAPVESAPAPISPDLQGPVS